MTNRKFLQITREHGKAIAIFGSEIVNTTLV